VLRALAALVVQKSVAWAIILVVVATTVFFATRAGHVERDDDLLAFLPQTNPDIQVFYDVNRRFGGLDVALVGIAANQGDPAGALAPDLLVKLRRATQQLNETHGVDYAMSLTNFEDFTPDPEKGGIGVDYLIPAKLPETPAEREALRAKVFSRDQVVGNVISADGKAALIYCFLAYGNDPKTTAAAVRAVVEESIPGHAKYWGGVPFVQSYIFGVTQADLGRLTPWACVVIVLISLWAFRDVVGMLLALFTTAVGIVAALGLMGTFGVPTNLVLGSMPVILFALGSAYPIHMLVRYYAVAKDMGRDKAIEHIITYLGPTVIASGLTAVGGLLSLVAMDMQPIRTFGLFTGVGVLVTLALSVTFVPAVIRVADLKPRLALDNHTSKGMIRFTTAMARHRLPVGVGLVALAAASALFVGRIDSRIDNSSFYSAKSPPAQAERFLRERFGGSQFFQLHVTADMNDPDVLREVRGVADRVSLLPHVSSVNHVGVVIAKINEAMEGDERIPDTGAKVKLLYGFLAGKRAVSQLVTDDRAHALLHVKVDSDKAGDLEALLAEVEKVVAEVPARYAVVDAKTPEATKHVRAMVAARIRALATEYGVAFGKEQIDAVERTVEQHGNVAPGSIDHKPIEAAILAYLGSEEFTGDIPKTPADAPRRLAAALATLAPAPTKDAIAKAAAAALDRAESDPAVLDIASVTRKPLAEILRRQVGLADARRLVAEARLGVPEAGQGQRFVAGLGAALMDLDVARVVLPAPPGAATAATFETVVTGTPVLNRGLSRSVDENQLKSFFMAMGLVLVIVLYLYRSLTGALLAMAPVSLTLLVVYGGMGLLGVHLDIGTSMLASLTTGAGVDYALHLLAAWKGGPAGATGPATQAELKKAATYASFLVGRAIWTNALMVAGGFVVLTMGEARPLQNVGGLTAAAMMAAALATFVAIPVLARKRCYDARPRIAEILSSSDAAEVALGAAPVPSPAPARGSS
jgi:predicted RND superfamily exporter protein